MNRSIIRATLVGLSVAGLLTLAGCGSTTTSKDNSPVPTSSRSMVADTAAPDSTTGDTSVAVTVDTIAAPVTSASSGSTAVVVDPALEQALNDASALLSGNDRDLTDASSAASRGD